MSRRWAAATVLALSLSCAGCGSAATTLPATQAAPTRTASAGPSPTTASPSSAPASETPARAITLTTTVLPRSTTDRPDERTGNQIHVMYAIPSDGRDRQRDVDGEIVRSVHAIQAWFAQQTNGGSLNLDTAEGGALDVTFVRLPESNMQIAAYGSGAVDHITQDLKSLGFVDPVKLYAVYYDGANTSVCGSTPTPSDVAALYLEGTPSGAPPCDTNPVGTDVQVAGYIEFSMLHEIVHALGFVPDCAPHSTGNGHVGNNPRDLMYAGDQPWEPSELDPSHTDYFRTGSTTCPDLASSPYLTVPPA